MYIITFLWKNVVAFLETDWREVFIWTFIMLQRDYTLWVPLTLNADTIFELL